jgi:hypothetical protein|tara:strand:+ start:150 stop:422 length:273 start_codon:yes stop_codon:yes gene_type:complete
MGKVASSDIQKLKEAGVLSKKAISEMEKTGSVSKKSKSITRFLKTADGKMVIPRLYMRGGRGSEPSKKMNEFLAEYQNLLEKYTTVKKGK